MTCSFVWHSSGVDKQEFSSSRQEALLEYYNYPAVDCLMSALVINSFSFSQASFQKRISKSVPHLSLWLEVHGHKECMHSCKFNGHKLSQSVGLLYLLYP